MQYADVIVDISAENLDKTYQYKIPTELEQNVHIGTPVILPFGKGNRTIKGYIVGMSNQPKFEVSKIKSIKQIVDKGQAIEGQLMELAAFIKNRYGGTMNDALKTVIPVKKSIKQLEIKTIEVLINQEELSLLIADYQKKHYTARVRLLSMLRQHQQLDYEMVTQTLKIPKSTLTSLRDNNIIAIHSKMIYRNPVNKSDWSAKRPVLTHQQQSIVDSIQKNYLIKNLKTCLIHGVTGSGKTEVYMELIDFMISQRKQVIVLIPEIALTYQTMMRFQTRFLNRVSILNSKMSAGERYDQIERAKKGEIDIIIGPRSALFTPFQYLGLIIIDEEHESSYKSEMPPKYHAREVAIKRAQMCGALVVLGSATPSLESYQKAKTGEYELYRLNMRPMVATLPTVHIVDLKEELKNKNKSIFSYKLRELMNDRLAKNEQIMLFLNRRGFAGFVSCRSCGLVMKCPHCDISLTFHSNGDLKCHYCGYETRMPQICPSCQSKYIAAFGTGTQKVESMVLREFPQAKILRMDADTTKSKNSYDEILSTFAQRKADILIGTQMIVKGHDFEGVTLVGVLAADLSLYAGDYRASERTFQLLAQAAGRAGRGALPGEVVIQTYQPDHYSIVAAANQDYVSFFEQEINYRKIMKYPPVAHIMAILIMSKKEEDAKTASELLAGATIEWIKREEQEDKVVVIGPSEAGLAKKNDIFRRICYVKSDEYEYLTELKDFLEEYIRVSAYMSNCNVQFDFDPMNGY